MDKIDLHSIKSLMIFKTLVENGTATRTARVLGITQSGVSRSLSQLEQNLGLQLFIRQKNRLLATPEALELYEDILRLVSNLDELEHSVMALKEFGASRIGIAVIPGLAFGFIPSVIGKMRSGHPKLAVYLDIMSSLDVVHAVESGLFDNFGGKAIMGFHDEFKLRRGQKRAQPRRLAQWPDRVVPVAPVGKIHLFGFGLIGWQSRLL